MRRSDDWISIDPQSSYREVTVRLWGKGVTQRRQCVGAEIKSGRRLRVRAGQFIASRIDARNGAFGIIPDELDGAVVTNDFPVFIPDSAKLHAPFLAWLSKTSKFIDLCRAASEGTTNRVRLKEDRFLAATMPLPPIDEQRRIVARIDSFAAKIADARRFQEETTREARTMLAAFFRRVSEKAEKCTIGEVAPLVRRPAKVDVATDYPQISVRSFGRGTFHSGILKGSEITWEKPHLVNAGDVLVSNIKAWEGAVAVVEPKDDGRFGSHRYLTYVPKPGVVTSRWVCHYLLSPEGLYEIGEASPGSADRNRTTSARALERIRIPVPPYELQKRFDCAYAKVTAIEVTRRQSAAELDALMPSILDKAFKGELIQAGSSF